MSCPDLIGRDSSGIEARILSILRSRCETLSSAESCTGGNIAHRITLVPGASDVFLGGVVSYAASVKENVLGVPASIISEYGIVSSEVAGAMAEGVRRLTGSTYSVSTTGLAGPGGDGVLPEGTVWIGVSGPSETRTFLFQTGSSASAESDENRRKSNIEAFTSRALEYLLQTIP